jgi:flagellar P-ring protein precursor FlgI
MSCVVNKVVAAIALGLMLAQPACAQEVRLKDIGRFLGWRDNMLTGYGIVTGLAGTGDSSHNRPSRQALANVLGQFDMAVAADDLESRNVATVIVTATLPASSYVGDKMDIAVTSIGDARSLAGGLLVMTPLYGPDRNVYALAQGPVTVGGYRYDSNGNLALKNHPTAGQISEGGTVELAVKPDLPAVGSELVFILKNPDFTTAERVAEKINAGLGTDVAVTDGAGAVRIKINAAQSASLNRFMSRIETLKVTPDQHATVVVNEKTGTVVAGGDVKVSAVVISHGDLKVAVTSEVLPSQPGLIGVASPGVRSLVVTNTRLNTSEGSGIGAAVFPNTTVADLVQVLAKMRVSTRDMIAILQAVKTAGALHAELIVQ